MKLLNGEAAHQIITWTKGHIVLINKEVAVEQKLRANRPARVELVRKGVREKHFQVL